MTHLCVLSCVFRKGLHQQKKAVKELRWMFDSTAYFDSEQITSILMVSNFTNSVSKENELVHTAHTWDIVYIYLYVALTKSKRWDFE